MMLSFHSIYAGSSPRVVNKRKSIRASQVLFEGFSTVDYLHVTNAKLATWQKSATVSIHLLRFINDGV